MEEACRLVLQGKVTLTVVAGDITRTAVDAIVNAANERMLGGFGVDGAIHLAAGRELFEACKAVPEVEPEVRCPRGEARITPGFRLAARYVIHTVGPWYESHEASAPVLRRCYESCLRLANEYRLSSVAFPAISCGGYGYPLEEAAKVAIESCQQFHGAVTDLRFVLYGCDAHERWAAVAKEMLGS